MILPIVVYGDPVLRKVGENITKDYEGLNELISNMYETMYQAKGLGIAAPQVGRAIRLFVLDLSPFAKDDYEDTEDYSPEEKEKLKNFKKVFINARMISETGEEWKFNEGCLSIPKLNEDVMRKEEIEIEYFDEKFVKHREKYDGVIARVIQHEYDHIDGKLFTDRLSPFKRKLIAGKLKDIASGKTTADYKTRLYKAKK